MHSTIVADQVIALLGDISAASLREIASVEAWARDLARVRCKVDSLLCSLALRAGELRADGQDLLRSTGRLSDREARKAMKRAALVRRLPTLASLLDSGSISTDHVDALARVSGSCDAASRERLLADGDELAQIALLMNPDLFERYLRGQVRRVDPTDGRSELERQQAAAKASVWKNETTGMFHIHAELDPETGERVLTALRRETEALFHGSNAPPAQSALMAAALVNLVLGGQAAIRPGSAEIIVITDLQSLQSGPHPATVCETSSGVPLPVDTVRRLCCESVIYNARLGEHGEVLALGRTQRLANRAQRRALRAMYRTCSLEGCSVPFDNCSIHHSEPWEAGGPTDLDLMAPTCGRHHHLLHEGGWRMTILPDRSLLLIRPDGMIVRQPFHRLAA